MWPVRLIPCRAYSALADDALLSFVTRQVSIVTVQMAHAMRDGQRASVVLEGVSQETEIRKM